MKNFAKLVIYFTFSFILVFIISLIFRFLSSWVDTLRTITNETDQAAALISAAIAVFPSSLFIAILMSLNYTVRRKIKPFLSIALISIFSIGVYAGFFFGMERIKHYDPALEIPAKFEIRPGFILSRLETEIVLVGEGASKKVAPYPRVVSFPERPLIFQETQLGPGGTAFYLPLESEFPWFIESMLIDFSLIAKEFNSRFYEGLFSFLILGCAVIILLTSLRFVMNISVWPLANFFLGALIFRLVLSLIIFLETNEVRNFFMSFVNNRLDEYLLTPLALLILGALINLYAVLTSLTGKHRRHNEA